jgi:D-sedoheptulose 7-phosphate isomerase
MLNNEYLNQLKLSLDLIDLKSVDKVCEAILETRKNRGTVFTMGNGGSATTASHMATDLMFGTNLKNPPVKAVSLANNSSTITATGNDQQFEQIFSRQISNLGVQGDLVIVISASGNSPNLIEAIRTAKSLKIQTIGLTGFDVGGGAISTLVDLHVNVPTKKGAYGPAEDAHLVISHMIVSFLKQISILEGEN